MKLAEKILEGKKLSSDQWKDAANALTKAVGDLTVTEDDTGEFFIDQLVLQKNAQKHLAKKFGGSPKDYSVSIKERGAYLTLNVSKK